MVNKAPVYTTFTQESINKKVFRYVVFGSKKFGPYNSVTSLTNIDEYLYFLATLEDGLYLFDEKGQKIAGPFVRNPILFSKILSYQGKPLFNSEKKVKPYIISDESFSDVPAQPIQTVDFFSKIKKLFLFSSNVKQKKSSISIGSESEWKLTLGTQIVASSSSPIIYFFVDQATGKIAYKREYYVGGTTCSGIMSENKWIVKGCMEEQVASFYGISNGVVAYSNLSSPIVTNDKIQPTSLKPNSEEIIAYFFARGKLFERLGSSMPKDLLYDGVSITDELSKQGLSLSQHEGFPMARDAYSVINDRLVLRVFDKGAMYIS